MNDSISRQAAISDFEWCKSQAIDKDRWQEAIDRINALPSVDVAKIVRCKDCKYYYYADNRIPSERGWVCANDGCYVSQNDYCSWGERKDG